jgi:hypothetical protein
VRSTGDLPPPLVGGVLGLVLGVVAAIALARADRRADHIEDLVEFVPCPVTPVPPAGDPATTAMLAAVVQRWDQALDGREVVLLPVGAATEDDAATLARRLSRAAETVGVPVRATGASRPEVDEADVDGPGASAERYGSVADDVDAELARFGPGPGGERRPDDGGRVLVRDPVVATGNGSAGHAAGGVDEIDGIDGIGEIDEAGALSLRAVAPPPVGLPRAMAGGHIVLVARRSDRITAIAEAEVELANFGLRPAWLLLVQR